MLTKIKSPPTKRRVGSSSPRIQPDCDLIDDGVSVRDDREVHPDGVVHLPVGSLVERDDSPRPFVEVIQGVHDGVVLIEQRPLRLETRFFQLLQHWIRKNSLKKTYL